MFEKLIFFIAILSRIDSYIYSYDNREKHNVILNKKVIFFIVKVLVIIKIVKKKDFAFIQKKMPGNKYLAFFHLLNVYLFDNQFRNI